MCSSDFDKKLQELISTHEGYRTKTYRDTKGIWSIGIGHNLEENPIPVSMLHEQLLVTVNDRGEMVLEKLDDYSIRNVFLCDVEIAKLTCFKIFPDFKTLPEPIQMVLIDMSFQMGETRLRTFKRMIKAVNDRTWLTMVVEMENSKWAKKDTPNRAKNLCGIVMKFAGTR